MNELIRPLKIGRLELAHNIVMAPMAGITTSAFRGLLRRGGAALVYSEMVSAEGLVRDSQRTRNMLGHRPEERPLGVQIFGTRPGAMAGAAALVEDIGADLVDINMGCPVKKVCRNGAGAALMKEPDRIRSILEAVRKATSLPVTVKMRAGWDAKSRNALEIAKIAEVAGVDGLVLHPRTRAQAFTGSPDIDLIRSMVETVSIPVLGNGGVTDPASALAMLACTGCAGIMIGRGALGKPWIFNAILESIGSGEPMAAPPPHEVARMMTEHIRLEVQRIGERQALLTMRKHLCWYSKGLPGGPAFRRKVNEISGAEELLRQVEEFTGSIH